MARTMSWVVAAVLAGVAWGQTTNKPASPTVPAPAVTPPAPAAQPAKPRAPLSLDDALSIPTGPITGPATDPLRDKLDSLLKQDEPEGDEFKQAIGLMQQSAVRLREASDTSIETQRVQEDAIRKLDQLIAKARKQQQQQQSSSSKSQDQKDQKKEEQQSQPKQAQSSQQERVDGRDKDSRENAQVPSSRDVSMRPSLESARAAWGNLPERLRQTLMQGAGDTFSKEYQRLTEEYYKRLGEQAE